MKITNVVSGVALQNFRRHRSFALQFPTQSTVIIGQNASGKTSVLEAIAMASTGNSFRAGKIEEMISFDQELGRCKVKTQNDDGSDEVEVIVTRGMVQGKRTQHRLFSVNGAKKRKKDAVGKFFTVLFRPEDMRLIEGSPARRRSFLDVPLSVLDHHYGTSLKVYDQTLKRRNKLLQQVREGEQPRASLQYWNLSLIKHGEILQAARKEFLATFAAVSFPLNLAIVYEASVMSEARLEEYLPREIAAGHTLIGPHKDDISIILHDGSRELPVAVYGSRGQQRLAVLWLKYCELEYLAHKTGQKPVLLLDDIMSELDADSQKIVLETLTQYQSVVTSTDADVVHTVESILGSEKVTLHTFLERL
ncbi:MAG: DNA replication and repair protein RecF [Candidatus Pacebacteria bacterium]|nr:DNA replication and repair protein RecF [Candidatus Paceibacterota bacterium]PIR64161.1 MAG: hypothetical protein COU64_00395 [Candidatus Pacebacteria bacterium CG10_big_fil_rev_8_21_14_0_10_40_26]PIZ79315.1 MAG: hypothetical protein COY01_02725 [Candidatus Pacebacteria bacterium CG_4_10_14_0_2_um_filter_40_20]PJA68971.1 MAG: hypothetical protein CO156_03335 [Candidatus Pacebacteria bacterium CG_4_9_14_3_um_filter_40_12]PJC42282.1 MAG: hypothetical protein CO041_01435 [Candidatus Pacebacteri